MFTVSNASPSPEKVIGLGIVACGVGEIGDRVEVGVAVENEVGKVVVIGADVVVGEHEAKIAVMRNAVITVSVFIIYKIVCKVLPN